MVKFNMSLLSAKDDEMLKRDISAKMNRMMAESVAKKNKNKIAELEIKVGGLTENVKILTEDKDVLHEKNNMLINELETLKLMTSTINFKEFHLKNSANISSDRLKELEDELSN